MKKIIGLIILFFSSGFLKAELILNAGDFVLSQRIPLKYVGTACGGENIIPEIYWSDTSTNPDGSYAVMIEDLDKKDSLGFNITNWIVFNIPPESNTVYNKNLDQTDGLQSLNALQGTNSFGNVGYDGPCTGEADGIHRFQINLYKLNIPTLGVGIGAGRIEFENEVKNHLIEKTSAVGRYWR